MINKLNLTLYLILILSTQAQADYSDEIESFADNLIKRMENDPGVNYSREEQSCICENNQCKCTKKTSKSNKRKIKHKNNKRLINYNNAQENTESNIFNQNNPIYKSSKNIVPAIEPEVIKGRN